MHPSRAASSLLCLAALLVGGPTASAAPPDSLRVTVDGVDVPPRRVESFQVDQKLGMPDYAVGTLLLPARAPLPKPGALLVVTSAAGGGATTALFEGEVVAVEPTAVAGGQRVVISGYDALHRLTRGLKSRTWEKQSDADIVARIAAEAGLQAEVSGPGTAEVRAFVYQRNETDLEFLRARADSQGLELSVDGLTLRFGPPASVTAIETGCPTHVSPATPELVAFRPRLSSASVVKKVIVRGWDPKKREEIVGEAHARRSPLGEAACREPEKALDLGTVDLAETPAAAHAVARGVLGARYEARTMAEVALSGAPFLRPGRTLTVGASWPDGRLVRAYQVLDATHRYTGGAGGGYETLARLSSGRAAGFYCLPEVDDEVLVGFVTGDLRHPVVLGSVWNERARPEESLCGAAGDPAAQP